MRILKARSWVLFLAPLLMSVSAQGAFVDGTFWLGSTSMQVTATDIIFYTLPALTPSTGAAAGDFQVLPPVTGSFAGRAGQIGDIRNITRNPGASPYAFAPTDTTISVPNFMLLPASPQITFTLTGIASGRTQDPTSVQCTPANWNTPGLECYADPSSPFLLQNRVNPSGGIDTYFTLTANGEAWFVGTPQDLSTWVGSFSGSIAGQTIGQSLTQLSSTGRVDTSIQGSVAVVPIPEPSMTLLLGGLFLTAGALYRRRLKRG